MAVHDLPTLNAILNATAGLFLVAGLVFIRQRRIERHRAAMVGAMIVSALFLVSYLYYHYHTGSTRFQTPGVVRAVYLTILLTHTVLAVVILPFILVTVYRALKGDFARHRRVARWTWPLWMYVSVTGVVIYLMLYHLDPWLLSR